MKRWSLVAFALACFSIIGCSAQPQHEQTWHIGVGAPEHYDVWVEDFELMSSGDIYRRMQAGYVSCCWKGPRGPRGKGGPTISIPGRIMIRWYSFAENKTYQTVLSLPADLRERMLERAAYETSQGQFERPRDILTVGVAPGGTVVAWIQNQIGNEIEVARTHAKEIEGTSAAYQSSIKRYREENGDFIDEHGVPTEGW